MGNSTMDDHSHHHHHTHHSHHMMMDNDTETTFNTLTPTTAATIFQAVMTTITTQNLHQHHHQSPIETEHVGHTTGLDQLTADSAPDSHIHSAHVGSGDHMPMYFHFGVDSIILFKEWTTSTTEGIIFSVIGIIILAMIYEGIKFFREYLFKKYFTSLEYSSVSVLGDDGKPVSEVHKIARNRMLSLPHLLQTFLHVVQMILSYFLMLIFMTFNLWLCGGVVIGAGIGYYLFGWRKATVVDITEHCH